MSLYSDKHVALVKRYVETFKAYRAEGVEASAAMHNAQSLHIRAHEKLGEFLDVNGFRMPKPIKPYLLKRNYEEIF